MQHALADMSGWVATLAVGSLMVRIGTAKKVLKIRRTRRCATGRVVMRQTQPDFGVIRPALEACAAACRACGDQCERHVDHHEHCRICAAACPRFEQSCNDLLGTIPTPERS